MISNITKNFIGEGSLYHSRERSDNSRQQRNANTMNIAPNPFDRDRDESRDDLASNYIEVDNERTPPRSYP